MKVQLRFKFIMVLLLVSLMSCLTAKNLGIFAHTFQIAEQNTLDMIHDRLTSLQNNGQLKQIQDKATKKAKEYVLRPTPVKLSKTTNPHIFYFTPTFTLKQDVTDGKGNIIYHKGLTVNPMDTRTYPDLIRKYNIASPQYTRKLVFFNADDRKQFEYVSDLIKEDPLKFKLVLIGGNVKTTSKTFKTRVYFDQAGVLSKRFHLQHAPSIVEQEDVRWKVTEIDVENNKAAEVING